MIIHLPARLQATPGTRGRTRSPAPSRAFTLLEVLLAIVIAVGMLVVVLYFYHQSAELRTALIEETERISSVRLLMDRLTAELRGASGLSSSRIAFAGDASSLRFITTALPARSAWTTGPSGRLVTPETDLKFVSYSLGSSVEGSNVVATGLIRTEQPTVEVRQRSSGIQTNPAPAEPETVLPRASRGPEPVTDAIRYLRFRYWDGSEWKESWSGVDLPQAVEVTFAGEAPPEMTEPGEYSIELFRRVIYLPGHEASGGLGAMSSEMEDLLPGEGGP